VQETPQELERLVEAAQGGQAEAFGVLYDQWVTRVYRYVAYRVGPGPHAEDLTAETFLRALEALHSFRWRGDGSFSAWLFRIAHNQVIDSRRRQTRRPTVPLDEEPEMPGKEGDFTDRSVGGVWVRQALAHLTHLQQAVVGLRFGSDLSIEETARVLGKSQGAVKALQHAAIVALRKLMDDSEKPSEAGSHGEGRV